MEFHFQKPGALTTRILRMRAMGSRTSAHPLIRLILHDYEARLANPAFVQTRIVFG